MRESDWKKLRQLQVVALERLCASALDEIGALLETANRSNHERFLAVFQHIQDRNDDITVAFDDLRRSTADHRLAAMRALGLVTSEELAQFSEETQSTVEFLAGSLYKDMSDRWPSR